MTLQNASRLDRIGLALLVDTLERSFLFPSFEGCLAYHRSMMPRLAPIATAWVRSFASSYRHLQVHQRDVGMVLAKLFERLPSIAGFRNHLHVGLIPDQGGDPSAQKRMVVEGQNSNHMSPCFLRKRRKTGLPGGVRYAIDPATLNSISVPAPSRLQISNLPPICRARSRMPRTP